MKRYRDTLKAFLLFLAKEIARYFIRRMLSYLSDWPWW